MFEKFKQTVTNARFWANKQAKLSMGWIIGLVIGLTVAAALLPDAIVDISCSTSYAGAPASVITIMTIVIPIAIGAALVMKVLKR